MCTKAPSMYFATKFYTEDGIFDLVGNDIPVFFIQDAIKFPDLIHAVKPEPHNEMPQGGTAHDTFWDFFAQNPEYSGFCAKKSQNVSCAVPP